MTSKLATLLGEDWISEDIIDMMMSRLSARLKASPGPISSHTIIGTLAFSAALKFSKNQASHPLLKRYADEVKNLEKTLLIFPIHTGGNHWIVGFVDFERRTFGYGTFLSLFQCTRFNIDVFPLFQVIVCTAPQM